MAYDTILFDVSDGIVTITLNRPERANALTEQFKDELRVAMEVVEVDPTLRVVIVTGAGRHFCAGGDLSAARSPMTDAFGRATASFASVFELSRVPVIAAINGASKGGGCELALACDFRIMADTAKIGLPEINFGGVPGAGGTQRLPRLIGIAAAKEMLYLGGDRTADEALRIGLVNRVVPPDQLIEVSQALARDLMQRPAYALAATKRLIHGGLDMVIADALDFERETHAVMATPEERASAQVAATARSDTYAKIFQRTEIGPVDAV